MNRDVSTSQADMAAQLERLVAGELDEPSRGAVVAWLDKEPRRWRLCGLSFLEAQTWSAALAEWPPPSEPPMRLQADVAAMRHSRGDPTAAAQCGGVSRKRADRVCFGVCNARARR